jgi:hypothetical protein
MHQSGAQDPARLPSGGDGAVPGVPLALAVCLEGESGYFRRNHLVPVPRVADLDALNTMLMTACRTDEAWILDGRTETIGAAMAIERGRAGRRRPH